MARRRKKRRRRAPAPAASGDRERGYSKAREKDEAARAALVPLEPGERPLAVTVGAVLAALACLSNLVALVTGFDTGGNGGGKGLLVFGTLISGLIAVGLWYARYWAVLGLQTLLALTIVFGAFAVIGAGSLGAALLAVLIVVLAGVLFWFLVKAMARIQMPEGPGVRR